MATTFMESGSDADWGVNTQANGGFWGAIPAGAPSSVNDFVYGFHQRSIQYHDGLDATDTTSGAMAQAGGRVTFRIYITSFTSAASPVTIFSGRTSINAACFALRMNKASLQFWNGTTAQLGANVGALNLNTWYRISVAYTQSSTTVNEYRVFIDGTLSLSLSNQTLTNIACVKGRFRGQANTPYDCRMTDFYFDDDTSLTDMGNISVISKSPEGDGGTLVEFTTQIGSASYFSRSDLVSEKPVNTANGWSISTTTKKTEEYLLISAGGSYWDITSSKIIDVAGWVYADVDSTANSPVHHIIVANTAYAITLTTSPAIYIQITGSHIYPTHAVNGIGIDAQYTTTPHLTRLYDCGVMIAFIPTTLKLLDDLGTVFVKAIDDTSFNSVKTVDGTSLT